MKEGEIALAGVPQADNQLKVRPILLLRELPPYNDFLVCGISSQTHKCVEGFDEIIFANDPDFVSSGLITDSVIRLGFLAVIPPGRIIGSIGEISFNRYKLLLRRLSNYLIQKI